MTALQRIPQTEVLVPRFSFRDMQDMAEHVAKSGLFKMTGPQILTLMLLADSEGIHPIQALMRWDVIDGKPSKKALTVLAEFQSQGGVVEWGECNEREANAIFSHPKSCPVPFPVKFTLKDAERAKLSHKDNWVKYAADMLINRVIVRGVRRALPGAIVGIYDPDELPEAPTPVETNARATLTAKLRERAGSPKESHQPVSETVAELATHANGNGEKSDCRLWVEDSLKAVNEAIVAADPAAKSISVNQIVNHVIKESVSFGTTKEADLLRDDGKRDSRKVAGEINRLWADQNQWVRDVAQEYMLGLVPEVVA